MEIEEIFLNEDKRNPFTDGEIAKKLGIRRELVTDYRLKNGISDSRERRKDLLQLAVEAIVHEQPDISNRQLGKLLNDQGFKLSKNLAANLKNDYQDQKEVDNFDGIIGKDGSLLLQIKQAKAAIIYPPNGLNTLIYGPSGVGKSSLAEQMYRFGCAYGTFKNKAFVIFNCADYADNPQLLLSQLFGYKKGAFTGADSDKEGVIENARGGLLFLDEVHRLPDQGQEMLFYLLDKGKYKRLGETRSETAIDLMIVAATTENLESNLLTTFRRRIPMLIELPDLKSRPISERMDLIRLFISNEVRRLNKTIKIDEQALFKLLSYNCIGNVGQLNSDIKVSCANAFLQFVLSGKDNITLDQRSLPKHIRTGTLTKSEKNILKRYSQHGMTITKDTAHASITSNPFEDMSIYRLIDDEYKNLQNQNISKNEIVKQLRKRIEKEFNNLILEVKNEQEKFSMNELIGEEIFDAVEEGYENVKQQLGNLSKDVVTPLCLHIYVAYARLKNNQYTNEGHGFDFVTGTKEENLHAAEIFLSVISSKLNVNFPAEEQGYIAMYFKAFSKEKSIEEDRIQVIILTHGKVGIAMAEVANTLLNTDVANGISLDLGLSAQEIFPKVKSMIKEKTNQKGCLVLTDMGSLVNFGEKIKADTGLMIETIARVDTVMVIEAVRRSMLSETELKDLADQLREEKRIELHPEIEINPKQRTVSKKIVTLCMTGKGAALLLKNQLKQLLAKRHEEVEIEACSFLSDEAINRLNSEKAIIACVGNYQPENLKVPFFSASDLADEQKRRELLALIKNQSVNQNNSLVDLLTPENIQLYDEPIEKTSLLDSMIERLSNQEVVDEEFAFGVYKREMMGGTLINDIAIPHGFPENVLKSQIVIAVLKKPIIWEEKQKTSFVILCALKEDSEKYLKDIFTLLNSNELSTDLMQTKDQQEIFEYLTQY